MNEDWFYRLVIGGIVAWAAKLLFATSTATTTLVEWSKNHDKLDDERFKILIGRKARKRVKRK